jgi:hypothetical protein
MNTEFLATVAMIAPDPASSRKLYVETLGLPLQGEGDGYHHSEQIAGCKSFGSGRSPKPPRPASEPTSGLRVGRCLRSASSLTSPTPPRSLRRHTSSSRQAMSCCTDLVRNRGARRSRGCSHPEGAIVGISYAPVLHD